MAGIDTDSISRNLGENRARLTALGVNEKEMLRYYNACGAEGERQAEALKDLVGRFNLGEEDAAFVAEVLGNCAPF